MFITAGAIGRMLDMSDSTFTPIVQVIHTKRIVNTSGNGADERWRIVLSDGIHYLFGLVAPQLAPKIHSGEITRHCLLRLDEFIVHVTQSGQKTVVLLGYRKMGTGPGAMIGIPQSSNSGQSTHQFTS
ncbi:hypothetical protein ACHAWF_017681 [Thalassiosira exigua]